MCQLLGMNSRLPASLTLSFTGFAQRGGGTDHHSDGWGIAFFEYCLMVPANRWGVGSGVYTAVQLKILQEAITLFVFCVFAVTYLGERLRWNHYGACLLVCGAVLLSRWPDKSAPTRPTAATVAGQ